MAKKTTMTWDEFQAEVDRIAENGDPAGKQLMVIVEGSRCTVDGTTIHKAKEEIASILRKAYRIVGQPQEFATA